MSSTHILRKSLPSGHQNVTQERCVATPVWFLWLQLCSWSAPSYWSLCSRKAAEIPPQPLRNRTFLTESSSQTTQELLVQIDWLIPCSLMCTTDHDSPTSASLISPWVIPQGIFTGSPPHWASVAAQLLPDIPRRKFSFGDLCKMQLCQCWCSSSSLIILISFWVYEPETSDTRALLPLIHLIIKQIMF